MENKRVIPIRSKLKKFYKQVVVLLNPILGLRGKEQDVLAELMYYNYKYQHLEEKIRWKVIMDYDTRTEIQQTLDISAASLYNIYSSLRKKGIIKENKVNKNYLIVPKEEFSLVFKFTVDKDESDNKGNS
jgi:CRP-like cAMP-binding protein